MADETSTAAAVQDAGNGEAKVSKNALKKQVMRLPLGRLQPFLFPSRIFFVSTHSVRKCKDLYYINKRKNGPYIIVYNRIQFWCSLPGPQGIYLCAQSLFPGAASPGSRLQSARFCILKELVRNAGKKWPPRDDRLLVYPESSRILLLKNSKKNTMTFFFALTSLSHTPPGCSYYSS